MPYLIFISLYFLHFITAHGAPLCPDGWLEEHADPVKCLKIVTDPLSWTDAWTQCLVVGNKSTLLHISNVFENNEIYNLIKGFSGCNQFYMGLYRNIDDQWIWTTGELIGYAHWKPGGYPTNNTMQNYVTFDGNTGTWYNTDGNQTQCYVCQQFF